MKKVNNNYLKIAIQKSGRLSDDSFNLLKSAGLNFESYSKRLFTTCSNFPLEILYVRDDDILNLVEQGSADIGIVGENLQHEEKRNISIVKQLGFGKCSLVIAVPKDSHITSITQLTNGQIATTYPNSVCNFFKKRKIPINIVEIKGSVEISPAIGMTEAIADLTVTGSSLALNELKKIETIYDSEAILIANKKLKSHKTLEQLLLRLEAVLVAKNYKYIMMNAPGKILSDIQKLVPGLKSPTISSLTEGNWISIQTVVKEDIFWETIEQLKYLGAKDIIVLPIEKMII